jgi:hypothetical protein
VSSSKRRRVAHSLSIFTGNWQQLQKQRSETMSEQNSKSGSKTISGGGEIPFQL